MYAVSATHVTPASARRFQVRGSTACVSQPHGHLADRASQSSSGHSSCGVLRLTLDPDGGGDDALLAAGDDRGGCGVSAGGWVFEEVDLGGCHAGAAR